MVSVGDIKEKKVSVPWLIAGGILIVFMKLLSAVIFKLEIDPGKGLWGMLPGILLLLLSMVSDGVGSADGIVCMWIGMFGGIKICFSVLCMGLFLASLFSVGGVLFRKWGKKKRFPFLPFLSAAFLIHILLVYP